ncbi:MAG TPA: hypothetical protein VMU94_08675 [Streptosporangiaceae bacterium]|nr:hypothetical protein [Streptosporangiaceae bacterium]
MAHTAGRAISTLGSEPGRQKGRVVIEGPWSLEPASGGQVRDYARHARSLSARRARQRVLVLALAGIVVAIGTVVAGPRAVRILTARPDAAAQAAVSAREKAAAWIVQWVSNSAMISCDPLMCTVLHARGMPSPRLARIGIDAPDPEGSDVVAATEAIRQRFGVRLARVFAPTVLASFGHGPARVDVRVVTNVGGARRYLRQLQANEQARRTYGRAFARNGNLAESRRAARLMRNGRVDLRILTTLVVLVHEMPLTILGFGGAAPGSGSAMPLLSVDVTAGTRPGGITAASSGFAQVEAATCVAKIMDVLRAQIPPLQPASFEELQSPDGLHFVRIDYGAPTPTQVFTGPA